MKKSELNPLIQRLVGFIITGENILEINLFIKKQKEMRRSRDSIKKENAI